MNKKYSKRQSKLNLNKNLIVSISNSRGRLECYFKTLEDCWGWFKGHNIKLIEEGDWFKLSRKYRMNLDLYFYNHKNKNLTKKQFINLMIKHPTLTFLGGNGFRYYTTSYNDKTIYDYHNHIGYWTSING